MFKERKRGVWKVYQLLLNKFNFAEAASISSHVTHSAVSDGVNRVFFNIGRKRKERKVSMLLNSYDRSSIAPRKYKIPQPAPLLVNRF